MFWRATEKLHVRYVTTLPRSSTDISTPLIIEHREDSENIPRSLAEYWNELTGEYRTYRVAHTHYIRPRLHICHPAERPMSFFFLTSREPRRFLVSFSRTPVFPIWTHSASTLKRATVDSVCYYFSKHEKHTYCVPTVPRFWWSWYEVEITHDRDYLNRPENIEKNK